MQRSEGTHKRHSAVPRMTHCQSPSMHALPMLALPPESIHADDEQALSTHEPCPNARQCMTKARS